MTNLTPEQAQRELERLRREARARTATLSRPERRKFAGDSLGVLIAEMVRARREASGE